MPRPKQTPFNVLFSDADRDRLQQLCDLRGTSRGQVLRELVKTAHQMQLQHTPMCASGQPCFVPQMHAMRPPLTAER